MSSHKSAPLRIVNGIRREAPHLAFLNRVDWAIDVKVQSQVKPMLVTDAQCVLLNQRAEAFGVLRLIGLPGAAGRGGAANAATLQVHSLRQNKPMQLGFEPKGRVLSKHPLVDVVVVAERRG